MGTHDTCQNSLHSFLLTLAAAINKTSANTFQRLHKRQTLNTELTATYKYCSYLVTCLIYSSQLNYIHIGKQYFMRTHMLHAVTLLSCVYYRQLRARITNTVMSHHKLNKRGHLKIKTFLYNSYSIIRLKFRIQILLLEIKNICF
jgi:hypothetical protein